MENTKEQVVAEWKAVNEPRLKEIKSANPDLYSAINLALNYLNKKLGGDELPIEVEQEVEVEVETQPSESKQWTLDDFKYTKIIVDTPEKSIKFQELLLSLGAEWLRTDVRDEFQKKLVNNINDKYLLVNEEGTIYLLSERADWEFSPKEERIYEEIFPEETETNVWRFKTREELNADGIDDFRSINPKYVYENYAGKPWDELYDKKIYKSLNEAIYGYFKDGYSLSSLKYYTQNPLPAQSTANPETYPAQSELTYNYSFTPNKGERKSPTQSAGELKKIAEKHSTSAVQIELLSTKFKGNDGNWYGINIGKTGTWTWKETTPPPAQTQMPSSTASSQPAPTTTTNSQWKPEDLLGRMINWNGSIFTINKIVKRNPKTIRYEFLNTSSAPMQVDVPKITIEALVTGNRTVKGVSLIPTQSQQSTSTPENDFQLQLSKMTLTELGQLSKDTREARAEFTPQDEEYNELTEQLVDIEKEIKSKL